MRQLSVSALACIALCAGCPGPSYAVSIVPADGSLDQTVRFELAVVRSCSTVRAVGPLVGSYYASFRRDEMAAAIGTVEGGTHGVAVRQLDVDCGVIALGCTEFTVGDTADTVRIETRAIVGEACDVREQCIDATCETILAGDSGLDGATTADASFDAAFDATLPDAGFDGASDIDSGSDAAIVDAAPSPCVGSTLCDDFEADHESRTLFSAGGSTARISNERTHSGERSLRVVALADATLAFAQYPMHAAGAAQWTRAYYYFSGMRTGLVPLETRSETRTVSIFTVGATPSSLNFRSQTLEPGSDPLSVPLPQATWTCIEMAVVYDEEVNPNAVLFVDGIEAAGLQVPTDERFNDAVFGISFRDDMNPAPFEVFVDDIVISTERVGCD